MTLYDHPTRSSGDPRADWAAEAVDAHYRAGGSAVPQPAAPSEYDDHFRSGPPRHTPYDVRSGGAHHRPEPPAAGVYDSSSRHQFEPERHLRDPQPAVHDSAARLQRDPHPAVHDSSTRLRRDPERAVYASSSRIPEPAVYDSSTRVQRDPQPAVYDSSTRVQRDPQPAVHDSSTRLRRDAEPAAYDSSSRLQFEPTSAHLPPARISHPAESSARYMTDTRTEYAADPATRAKYVGDTPAEWPGVPASVAQPAPAPAPVPATPTESWTPLAEQAPPARNGRATMIGAILAVAVASAGVTAGVMAAIDGSGANAAASAGPGGPGQGGGLGQGGGPGGNAGNLGGGTAAALHGTYVISNGDGGYTTQLTQTGTVSAVSATSITVKSHDGYSKTYVVGSSTSIDNGANKFAEVATGHTVRIVATTANAKTTATSIIDTNLASTTQNGQTGQNGQPSGTQGGVPGGQPGTAPNGTVRNGN